MSATDIEWSARSEPAEAEREATPVSQPGHDAMTVPASEYDRPERIFL